MQVCVPSPSGAFSRCLGQCTGRATNPPTSAHSTGLKTRAKGRPTWRVVAGPAVDFDPINLKIPLDPDTAARIRRANERGWVDTTEIATPSWPVVLMGGTDREHEQLALRTLNRKQEKTI